MKKTLLFSVLFIGILILGFQQKSQGQNVEVKDDENTFTGALALTEVGRQIDLPMKGGKKEPTSQGVKTITVSQNVKRKIIEREVLIHYPENIDSGKSYPVVFAFHGNGGLNDEWVDIFGKFVNSAEFIGIYPQGYLRSWNLGQEESHADDVEFFNMIVKKIADYPNLDMNRIYGIGYSNGSGLVNKLAIKTSHFKAIAACATQLIKGQEPTNSTNAVSVYQLCGTVDRIIPYEGGLSPVGHTFLSAKKSAERWAKQFNCNLTPEIEFIRADSLFIYSDCQSNREIRFQRVENGGHGLNQENDPDFYARIWRFLKSQ